MVLTIIWYKWYYIPLAERHVVPFKVYQGLSTWRSSWFHVFYPPTRKHSKPNSWAEEVRCNGCKVIKRYYLVYLWVNKNIPIRARMTLRYAAERQTTVDHKWLHWWNDHTFVVFPYIITLSRLPLYSLRRVFNGGRFLCIAPLLALWHIVLLHKMNNRWL